MTFEQEINDRGNIRCQCNYLAANLTSFHIGGEIAFVLFPKTQEELCSILKLIKVYGVPYQIIGNGTNILAKDSSFDGAWIVTKEYNKIIFSGVYVDVSCGVSLCELIEAAADRGQSGIENLYGIPGTIGGAITMNAGAYGVQIADCIVSVTVYDMELNRIFRLGYDQCEFGYRSSIFQSGRYVILGATLRLCSCRTDLVRDQMKKIKDMREASQPLNLPSAGSTFRRPAGAFAGKLIYECGLSGISIGGAMVSPKHSGFIVNAGGATAQDVKQLIALIKSTVLEKAGIQLEPEIVIL